MNIPIGFRIEHRRIDFQSRFGYAPDMVEAAEQVFVLYDPTEQLDAMHAALFERRNVTRFRAPFFGGALQTDFRTLEILPRLLLAMADDTLDTRTFAELLRARRHYPPYLRKLLARLDAADREALSAMLCRSVIARMNAPRFRRRLAQIEGREPAPDAT